MERNARSAAAIIESFKRVSVDSISDQRRRFPLLETVRDNISSIAPKTKAHSVKIDTFFPESEIIVDGFPGAVGQVVSNIIVNACLHAFEGKRQGVVSIWMREENSEALIEISDDGNGMPADVLSRIFEPFFTTKMGAGGSGLGLHIVWNIVHDILGGTVKVSSTPGKGTSFLIRFPLTTPALSLDK